MATSEAKQPQNMDDVTSPETRLVCASCKLFKGKGVVWEVKCCNRRSQIIWRCQNHAPAAAAFEATSTFVVETTQNSI